MFSTGCRWASKIRHVHLWFVPRFDYSLRQVLRNKKSRPFLCVCVFFFCFLFFLRGGGGGGSILTVPVLAESRFQKVYLFISRPRVKACHVRGCVATTRLVCGLGVFCMGDAQHGVGFPLGFPTKATTQLYTGYPLEKTHPLSSICIPFARVAVPITKECFETAGHAIFRFSGMPWIIIAKLSH